jgi:hypothetical protein
LIAFRLEWNDERIYFETIMLVIPTTRRSNRKITANDRIVPATVSSGSGANA